MPSRKSVVAALVLVLALVLAALAAPSARAQTPIPDGSGRIVGGSIPGDGGFGLVVFTGGTYDQLVAASGCAAQRVAFWVTQSGAFLVYVPTTSVGAVNAPFESAFPNRTIPANTPFMGRCTATLMLGAGVHPKIVSERLGHSTIAITMDTYSHVLPDMQREAAATLDDVLRGASTSI